MLTLDDALAQASSEIKVLFADADEQGWEVGRVTSDFQVRMHCACPRQHNQWFNARPKTHEYEARHRLLLTLRTCWQEGGGG